MKTIETETGQSRHRVSFVFPAHNEQDNIGHTIHQATEVADYLCEAYEIIVVDDGSTDDTSSIVFDRAQRDSRIRLISHDRNRGYGEALRTGFASCRMDLVFFTDADNQFNLADLERFLPWIDKVDVVAGYRLNRQDALPRRLNARAWNLLVRALFYVPVRDIDCAFKLFRRSVFETVDLESVGAMVNTELMVKLGRSGARVVEIGVAHYPRTAGRARGASPKVIVRALLELTQMYRRLRDTAAGKPLVSSLLPPTPANYRQTSRRRIVVIGGGIAGSAAALRLGKAGYQVTLIERSSQLGGLVVSFSIAGTPIECFYHHIFPHEHDVITLIHHLGLGAKLGWYESSTGVLYDGTKWPFTSPMDLLRFRPLRLHDRLHAGLGALRMGRVRDWQPLDDIPAGLWLRQYCGEAAGRVVWDPLLAAKFGNAAGNVPAAWMWGRLNQRSGAREGGREHLGYLRGGFKQLFDALHHELLSVGVTVRTECEVQSIDSASGRVKGVTTSHGNFEADAVLYAGTLSGLPQLLPVEQHDPRWAEIPNLGVLCVILELKSRLSNIYWTNVCDDRLPFGGIIEHTNLLPSQDYGGRYVVYLSRYFTLDEACATAEPREEAERWVDLLIAHTDGLTRDDILAIHPFRTNSAAPLVRLRHLDRIPPIEGPLAGLYLTTTAQIYPQDRGMDEGVKAGYRAADVIASATVGTGTT